MAAGQWAKVEFVKPDEYISCWFILLVWKKLRHACMRIFR
jgi:hypothetical protein